MNFTSFQPEEIVTLSPAARLEGEQLWDDIRQTRIPLNSTAAWLVSNMDQPVTVAELSSRFRSTYGIDKRQARSDVNQLLTSLNALYHLRIKQPLRLWFNLALLQDMVVNKIFLLEPIQRTFSAKGTKRNIAFVVGRALLSATVLSVLLVPAMGLAIWSSTEQYGAAQPTRLVYALYPIAAMILVVSQTIAHELGHLVVSQRLGNHCYVVSRGLRIFITHSGISSRRERRMIGLSGPVAGLLTAGAQALLLYAVGWPGLAVTAALMGTFNLLALHPSMTDGAMVFHPDSVGDRSASV